MGVELSERKKQILKAIVDDYVQTAEPVGSKAVTLRLNTNISSATVRNEMAELERLGYLEKPHTSAGRIPSNLGYRLYVDELMNQYTLTRHEIDDAVQSVSLRMGELDRLITEAGRMVSELTNQPAIAVSPVSEGEAVRRFEVIRVDESTVVLVLVTTSDLIKNRICRLNFPLSDLEVAAANRALNAHFTNIPIEELTDARITQAEHESGMEITEVLVAAIDFASEVLRLVLRRDVYLSGASRILKYPEFHEPDKAMALLECIADRDTISLLPLPDERHPVRIRIGTENRIAPLRDASIVMASYKTGKGATGLLGVVGPTRMDYAKVSARLKRFADELSDLLNS
jgi:heat-inducible transcriptional repressor